MTGAAAQTPRLDVFDEKMVEGDEFEFKVLLSTTSSRPVTVQYSTADGADKQWLDVNAKGGRDFTAVSGTLAFAPGETRKTVRVSTTSDSVYEWDERFQMRLSRPTNARLGISTATGTITNDDPPPTVSVSDGSATEGEAIEFKVSLSEPTGRQVSVSLKPEVGPGDTAKLLDDFDGREWSLGFSASTGAASATVHVTTTDDDIDEQDETFTLRLLNPRNATLGDATATGTIIDDDDGTPPPPRDLPTVGFLLDPNVAEGGQVKFWVKLSKISNRQVSVQYATSSGTAQSGTDFTAMKGLLTFPAGDTLKEVRVRTLSDRVSEGNETFELTLSSPINATLGDATATGTITEADTDVDGSPFVAVKASTDAVEGKPVTFTVRLSAASKKQVTVQYEARESDCRSHGPYGCAAKSGVDYVNTSGTLSFAPNELEKTVSVPTVDDSEREGKEWLYLYLLNPTNAAFRTLRSGTNDESAWAAILDNEAPPPSPVVSFASQASSVQEDAGIHNVAVNLSPAPISAITIGYSAGGTAAPGKDYGLFGRVSVSSGATTASIPLDIVVDNVEDDGETIILTLLAGTGYTVGTSDTHTLTIRNHEAAPPPAADPEVTIAAGADVTEGTSATFTLTADPAPSAPLDVTVMVAASGDYGITAGTQTVTVPTGGSATLTLATAGDEVDEADGSVSVTVDAGTGYTVGSASSGTVAIADDDAPAAEPAVTVALAAEGTSVAEDNGEVKFTVTLSRALAAGETAAVPLAVTGGKPSHHWNIRFRPKDNAPGVKRTAAGRDTAVTFTEGGRVATLVLIARPNLDTEQRTIRVAFGTGEHAPRATGVAGGIAPVGGAIEVAILDDDAAGAPALFVEDARARESAGAMRFAVRLTAPADEVVRVRARTRNARPVSARAGRDYERTRVDLRFLPGETRKHVRVALFDDGHDEGRETFELVLSNAEGAAIADRVAVGTIRNDDPLPAAYLARLGRTVAEQALDGIAGRMSADRTPGMQGTLAGQALSFDPAATSQAAAAGATPGATSANREAARTMADIARGLGAGASAPAGPGSAADPFGDHGFGTPSVHSRTMSARDALLGSRFSLTGQRDASGGSLAFWGRASQARFDGAERGDGTDIRLDGTVTTGMLGADYARSNWLIGLALTQSASEGKYASEGEPGCPEADDGTVPELCDGAVREGDGDVEASLTAAIPYAALQASERLKLWGAAGFGSGEVTLETAMGERLSADTSWTMAAAGVRGDLLEAPQEGSGPALALTSDALWTRTSSDETGELAATDSDATRLRLGLEGSYRIAMEGDSHLTPKLELGARHDGGDAETGFGVEVGGGIAWVDPTLGLSLDVSGRTLLAHENDDLKDRGFSAALGFDPAPATQRGPSFSLRQDFGGQAQGGLDALFDAAPLEERSGSEATSRWTMEAAYGLPVLGGRFTGSPHVGLGFSTNARDYSVGWRLAPEAAGAPDLSLGLKATRRESDTQAPEHTVGLEATMRW